MIGIPLRTGEELDRQVPRSNFQQSRRLFQRRIDGREFRVEGRTKTVDRSDNGRAEACGNQAVFDRGRVRLTGQEFCGNFLHCTPRKEATRSIGFHRGTVRLTD